MCAKRNSTEAAVDTVRNIEKVAEKLNNDVQKLTAEIMKMKNSDGSWQQEFELAINDTIDRKINERLAHLTATNIPVPRESSMEQHAPHSRRQNLIVTGIPELENECLITTILKLAKQISFTYQSTFIDVCFRVKKKESPNPDRPASILLKFVTETARDDFYKCYFEHIKANRLTPDDIGLTGNERIYINEHMEHKLIPLLKYALKLRREGKILKVSSYSTYISVKITSNGREKWLRIKDIKGFDPILGPSEPDIDLMD